MLLLTFVAFFVFSGNLARLPAVAELLRRALDGREYLTALLASQVVSNVPAALLLSGFTDNARALLMTRALTEMSRLAEKLGGRRDTLAGLAGIGDLIVTCTSMHSRNHRAGILIGQGKSAEEAMREVGAVVEGYYAAQSAEELSRELGVEMPICDAVYGILLRGTPVQEAVHGLMNRLPRKESDSSWVS